MEFEFCSNKYRTSTELNEKVQIYAKAYDIFNEPMIVILEHFQTINVPQENILGNGTKLEVFCNNCEKWVDYFKEYLRNSLNNCCEKCVPN